MNEFLNPKSMTTPGVAGALMMLITNALCGSFPEFECRWVALVLSFVIGAIVFNATQMKILERSGYWLINSLIIFSVGVGTNNIGVNAAGNGAALQDQISRQSTSLAGVMMSVFGGEALAEGEAGRNTVEIQLYEQLEKMKAKVKDLEASNDMLREKINEQQSGVASDEASESGVSPDRQKEAVTKNKVFFKRWFAK